MQNITGLDANVLFAARFVTHSTFGKEFPAIYAMGKKDRNSAKAFPALSPAKEHGSLPVLKKNAFKNVNPVGKSKRAVTKCLLLHTNAIRNA